jgi:beta-glucanase (GH16 family)
MSRKPIAVDLRSMRVVILALLIAACATGAPSSPPLPTPAPPAPTDGPTPSPTASPFPIVPPSPEPVAQIDGWQLAWQDEFDGEAIDPSNWTFDIGGWGWGNGEAQFYTDRPENARVEHGLLVIEARQEQYENKYYTSARLKTQGLREFQYGRIEARMRVPRGAGTWPAFWMLGADFDRDPNDPIKSNWPHVGEIDVMEHVGREPDLILGTIHGPGYAGAGGLTRWNRQSYDIADDFHTYAVEWDRDGIRWFYDGELYFDLGRDAVGQREWVFDRPFFLIVNLALGGILPGPIGLDTEFPLRLYVDHVRVYQPAADTGG